MNQQLQPGCFFGHRVRSCDVSGFTLSESRYSPGTRIAAHSHVHAYLSILLRGSYREVYDGRHRYCGPSTVVLHPAGEVHSDHFLNAGGTIFRFEISQDWLRTSDDGAAFVRPFEVAGGSVAWLATRLYTEFNRMDTFSALVMHGMVLEILGHTARHRQLSQKSPPPWLKRVTEFLHESSPDGLTVSKVAEIADVHVAHLSRAFRQFRGCSVGEYIRRLRIDYAAGELRSTSRSLAEIAVEAGFADQSHFCRSFKLASGATPAQYRSFFNSR